MLDKLELNTRAVELRNYLGEDDKSPLDIFALIGQIEKLTLVQYPLGEHISGMCIKEDNFKLIAVNSSMSYGRQRFSLAHELYHLYFDENKGFAICAKKFASDNEVEKCADQFASYFLAPYGAVRNIVQKLEKQHGAITLVDVIKLEQYFGMSHQAMLWRLIQENFLDMRDAENMRTGVIAKAKACGFEEKLYLPTEPELQKRTYGSYIQQAELLKDKELISYGKYEELLLDAFRYDIVYGDAENEGELID
jgi:Zn-dependent peptidase ImmA (M78 family)